VLDPYGARRRLHLEPGRRGRQDDGVTHPLVRPDQLPCLGKQPPGDLLREQPLAELGELVLRPAGPGGEAEGDEPLEIRLAGDPAQAEHQRLRGLDRPDAQAAQPVPVEIARGVPVDDGAVEVEERADRGARRSGQDVGNRVGNCLRGRHR
jgi:hypothetical protein